MDPVQMSKAIDDFEPKGYELIALFHTHPGGPSLPSGMDLDKRSIDVPMIIITPTEIKAYRYKDDKTFDEVRLAIHNTGPKVNVGPIKELRTDGLRITLEVSGKVFEELPGILKSFFSNRNGPAFDDRIRDIQSLMQLVNIGNRGVRDTDDPDALMSRLLQDPSALERLRVAVDDEMDHGLVAHGLIREQDIFGRNRRPRQAAGDSLQLGRE